MQSMQSRTPRIFASISLALLGAWSGRPTRSARALRLFAVGVALLAVQPKARADPEGYVERAHAERASSFLRDRDEVHLFCGQPCGETASELVRYSSVSFALVETSTEGDGLYELRIDDEPIDLAEAYVRQGQVWRNLALLVGHSIEGIPRTLGADRLGQSSRAAISRAHGRRAGIVGAPNCSVERVDSCAGCRELVERTCRFPGEEPTITLGACVALLEASFSPAPRPERLVQCDFAGDTSQTLIIMQDDAPLYAHAAGELGGISASAKEVVPNGEGVCEAVITEGTEDGQWLSVIAMRGDEPVEVASFLVGGGHVSPDFSGRVTFHPSVPEILFHASDGGRQWTERWRWDPGAWRFIRAERQASGSRSARLEAQRPRRARPRVRAGAQSGRPVRRPASPR